MAVSFKIGDVFTIKAERPKLIVIGELVDPRSKFWVTENSRLGGIEITKNFTVPRVIDKEGNPRLDIFAFEVKHQNEINEFKKGQIVELLPGDNLEILDPWESTDNSADGLERELVKELHEHHDLFQKTVVATAKRMDRDDVLFYLPEDDKYAVVHLTWKGKKEDTAKYPLTQIYEHWSELYEQRILPDYKDWND